MDFILKEQFLPFSEPKQSNIQYYQWLEKKRLQKQKAQYDQFHKRWKQIEQEQKANQNKKHRIGGKEQKCYNCHEEVSGSQNRSEQTYLRNVIWKENVEEKLAKARQEQIEEKAKRQEKQMNQKPKEKKMFKEPQHKGPIKAWQERFQIYVKAKSGDTQESGEALFRPKINQTSRNLTCNMTGKVQNRLLNYGQKLKEKKAELESAYQQQLFGDKNRLSNVSVESNVSDIFYRLYKDGQLLNKKRNQQRSEYTFMPQINQTSLSIASRVTNKRRPLYESKCVMDSLNQDKSKSQTKRKSTGDKGFEDFLKRNQALLHKQGMNKHRKVQEAKQKQNREARLCTFAPELNQKSLKIIANKANEVNETHLNILGNSKILNSQTGRVSAQKLAQMFAINAQKSSEQYDCNACLQRSVKPSQRLFQLNSQRHLLPKSSKLGVEQLQEIQNGLNPDNLGEEQLSAATREQMRQLWNNSRVIDSDIFATERGIDKSAIITEELEEDSIEKEKEELWENQLDLMESQIEAMMKRSAL